MRRREFLRAAVGLLTCATPAALLEGPRLIRAGYRRGKTMGVDHALGRDRVAVTLWDASGVVLELDGCDVSYAQTPVSEVPWLRDFLEGRWPQRYVNGDELQFDEAAGVWRSR